MPTLLASAPAAAWDPPIPILPPIIIPPVQATVYAHSPTTPEYRPSGYSHNNRGGILIRRIAVGTYTITLENASSPLNGVAHVVAYGGNPTFCTVVASHPVINSTANYHYIMVRCFNAAGSPVDSQFVATYTNIRGIQQGRLAYFTTDVAVPAGVRTIPSDKGYDSMGAPMTYQRLGVGRYLVNLAPEDELLVPAYGFHVTAFGRLDAVHCQQVWLYPDTADYHQEVWCRDAAGQFVDTRFSVTHGFRVDLLGNSTGRFSVSRDYAGWPGGSNIPTYNSETPDWTSVEKTVLGTGRYQYSIPKMATTYGTAFVSAERHSAPHGYCVLAGWGPSGEDEVVRINCYRYGGSPANVELRLAFTTWPAA